MIEQPTIPQGTLLAERYVIERLLGRGAFGRTYLARDAVAARDVAIKLLDPGGASDWKARELFEREASTLRGLRHHGVPEIHDAPVVEWNGHRSPSLVMEYIEGDSLSDRIQAHQSHDSADVVRLLLDLLGVLDYLHSRVPPVLHRDIKPANIIVRADGSAVLVDFGSVRQDFRGDEHGSTIVGTFGYMPYEQYMGQAVPASDLFALGATFLHLITGRPPREFLDADGRIALPVTAPGDPRLREVLARMLRPSPQERFPSAREARLALLSSTEPKVTVSAGRGIEGVRNVTAALLPAPLLEPVPRPSSSGQKELLHKLAPSVWEYMDTKSKPSERATILDGLMLLGMSLMTFGVYPMAFLAVARARRRVLRQFLRDGLPAVARIQRIDSEESAFGEKVARVHYEFHADGAVHRDSDQVLPLVASRWEVQEHVTILYVAGDPYESVIIGRA